MPYQYHFTNTNFTHASYVNAVIEVFREAFGCGYALGPDVESNYSKPLYIDELLPRLMSAEMSVADVNGTLWAASPTKETQGEKGSGLCKRDAVHSVPQDGINAICSK
ncbi:MAG: hypothetical protein LBG97_00370 [Coriobacteriales bacterium]|jgi:hypothetical protein|nr:hypothetical protein [Coriobacteriales bacterium]